MKKEDSEYKWNIFLPAAHHKIVLKFSSVKMSIPYNKVGAQIVERVKLIAQF